MLEKHASNAGADQAGNGACAKDMSIPAATQESPSLGSVLAVWVIFAPTAACAAYALITWASINRTRFNAIYAIALALFFAALFGSLVLGITRRYVRGRRPSPRN